MNPFEQPAAAVGGSLSDPSGAAAAKAAYDAGAVVPVVELPVHDCTLEFRVHATERDARDLVDALAAHLSSHPLVLAPVTATVRGR